MTATGTIEILKRPVRPPLPHEAVVRVEAVGVCGSDTAYFTVGYIGDYVVEGPLVLGHEVSGVVAAIGDSVSNVAVGERVAVEPGAPCRDCPQCTAGRYHLCPDLVFLATPPHDGALLEQLTIDARNLFPIPDSLSFEDGALLEPLSVGIWACRRAALQPGDDVLVTGAGPVGLLSAAVARALGAGSVTVSDISDARLAVAADLGFAVEHSGEVSDVRFDVLVECSGAPGVLATGLGRLRESGRAAVVGLSKDETVALPLSRLNPRELTIAMVNRYANTWPTAIALVSSGRVDLSGIVTHRFPLERTADALLAARTHPDAIKAVVHPQR